MHDFINIMRLKNLFISKPRQDKWLIKIITYLTSERVALVIGYEAV
jgi:hypothetical protein